MKRCEGGPVQLGAVRLGPSASSKGRPHAEGTGPVGSAKLPRTDGTQNEAKVGTEMNKVCYTRTRTRTRAFPEVGAYQDEGGSGPHTPNRAMSPAAENQINLHSLLFRRFREGAKSALPMRRCLPRAEYAAHYRHRRPQPPYHNRDHDHGRPLIWKISQGVSVKDRSCTWREGGPTYISPSFTYLRDGRPSFLLSPAHSSRIMYSRVFHHRTPAQHSMAGQRMHS